MKRLAKIALTPFKKELEVKLKDTISNTQIKKIILTKSTRLFQVCKNHNYEYTNLQLLLFRRYPCSTFLYWTHTVYVL